MGDFTDIKAYRDAHCTKCQNWIKAQGATVPRCALVSGTNCMYAIETGKCRYEPIKAEA